ncbi:MAG: hypothetical protein K5663_02165 [Clostridiales bacterium]|nr:hypothetical protein [Clostridiales bacterium]
MKRIIAVMLVLSMLAWICPALADGYEDTLSKGAAYERAGDYKRARACYMLAQRVDPKRAEAFICEAQLLIVLEEYPEALKLARQALDADPLSWEAWYVACELDVRTSDMAAFESDSLFAEVCGADLSDLFLPAALLYFKKGLYAKACEYFGMVQSGGLSEDEKELYGRSLVYSGQSERAEEMGLVRPAQRDARLDRLFSEGKLTLAPAELPAIKPEDFVFTQEMCETIGYETPQDAYAELEKVFPEVGFTWLSLSPEGNSGLLKIDSSGYWVAYRDGKYRPVHPSASRGAEDTHGNLARLFSQITKGTLPGEEGVVYSQDGRYAAVTDFRRVIEYADLSMDPVILDLETGELILTATYSNKAREENSGGVTCGTFSADGRYFYYILFGRANEYRTTLYRYDLEKGETEKCLSRSDFTHYPRLLETGDGSFVVIRDTADREESQALFEMRYTDGEWSCAEYDFDLPLKYWYANRLISSSVSGYTLIPGRIQGDVNGFLCVSHDELFDGLGRYMMISKQDDRLMALSAAEVTAMIESAADEASKNRGQDQKPALTWEAVSPFQTIMCLRVSPDGQYALALSCSREASDIRRHLFLIRLEDMEMKSVEGIDLSQISVGDPQARKYAPTMEWNTDTLLINIDGEVKAYKFE